MLSRPLLLAAIITIEALDIVVSRVPSEGKEVEVQEGQDILL